MGSEMCIRDRLQEVDQLWVNWRHYFEVQCRHTRSEMEAYTEKEIDPDVELKEAVLSLDDKPVGMDAVVGPLLDD